MATSNSNLDQRVNSLVKYILDIKPYHTKLRGFTSELSFTDTLALTFADSAPQHTLKHQNVWTAHDVPTLAIVSDGTSESQTFIVPPTVMPRFSVTDSVNYGQSPIGDDQALSSLLDSTGDGVPDGSYPWTGQPTFSHQLGADCVPVRLPLTSLTVTVSGATPSTYVATVSGSISVPYATLLGIPLTAVELRVNGVTTVINASSGTFSESVSGTYNQGFFATQGTLPPFSDDSIATAYIYKQGVEVWAVTDTGRYTVPWHNAARVRVNNVEQVFGNTADWVTNKSRNHVQFLAGKHPAPTDRIDINLMNADRLFIAQCLPFVTNDEFTLTVSSSAPGRATVSFANQQPGTRKAVLEGALAYPSQPNGATWAIKADGLFAVTVQQLTPIVGPIETAYINEPFNNGKIAFTLKAPWSEYYLNHGYNSYVAYDMELLDAEDYDRPADDADLWPDVNIRTKLGQPVDPLPPLHGPVTFTPVGELKQRSINGEPQYVFTLYTIPPQGSFVELRVEQAKQLNPRLQLSMHEKLSIVQMAGAVGGTAIYDTEIFATHSLTGATFTGAAASSVDRVAENADLRHTEEGDTRILE